MNDFNLDDWIAGVRATERSVEIYQRGDLVAVAEDLLRRYETAQNVPPADRGLTDDTPDTLLAQIEECQRQLEETRSTWTVRALSPEQVKAASQAAKDEAGEDGDVDLNSHLIAAAVVKVARGDGQSTSSVTVEHVRALRDKVGTAQVLRLMTALNQAMSEEPNIQAPSSRRR